MKNPLSNPQTPFFGRFPYIRPISDLYPTYWGSCTGAVTLKKSANLVKPAKKAREVSIPSTVKKACNRLSDKEISIKALNRFLRTAPFSKMVFEHKKHFPEVGTQEYMLALKSLLSSYNAGQSISTNDLTSITIEKLTSDIDNGKITRNALRDSFIPMLKEVGIIQGEKPLKWAHLDTQNLSHEMWQKVCHQYQRYWQKTEAEKQLERAQKEQYFLNKAQHLAAENRAKQEDIAHHLDFAKKDDAKCRKMAHELGVPYSELKQNKGKKKAKLGVSINPMQASFTVVVALMIGFGLFSQSKNVESEEPIALDPMAEEITQMLGFTAEEHQWRQRYITLFNQYKHIPAVMEKRALPKVAEDELIRLSGDFMITRQRLNEIISTIQANEINQ